MSTGVKTSDWQDILANTCTSSLKKKEIAQRVGFVSVRTIDRWISRQSKPQKIEMIRKLANAIPSEEMNTALRRAFPEAFQVSNVDIVNTINTEHTGIHSEIYKRVARAFAHVPFSARRWTIFNLLSNIAIRQLDPDCSGLALLYCRLEHTTKKILFEEGAGNSHWSTRQIQDFKHAGENAWLLQTVEASRPIFVQSLSHIDFPPPSFIRHDLIQSVAFFPLYRSGISATSGLLLCSAQENFFSPFSQALVEEYSWLFPLALSDNDFSL